MTCLKPTLGSTVREGTEALPSHRPSQRAAAQGKVHTQHMCARSYNTHTKSVGVFLWEKRDVLTIADDSTVKSLLEKGVYMHVCDSTLCTNYMHKNGHLPKGGKKKKSEKPASAPPHLICFFLLAGPPFTNSGNEHSVLII